jgi:hypothetical protein
MRNLRFMRVMLLALLVCLIPAVSSAAVFVSVGFAPPVLPVYVQPPCPQDGWMWTPGYWGYGDDGYYWVPGTWVPSPYVGALWTPGYWGWAGGLYVWHGGYWGPHVGYYGGVNYGFGYMGIGFAGGVWAGGAFRYNTAVMRVNTTVIHNTYVDRNVVVHDTVVNNHVAYSGGPGGINHPPTADESRFSHEQHTAPTSYQTHQESAARGNVNNYASHNGGHPTSGATDRPMTGGAHTAGGGTPNGGHGPAGSNPAEHGTERGAGPGSNPGLSHTNTADRPGPVSRPQPESHAENRPAPVSHPTPQVHTAPPSHAGGGGGGHPEGGHEKGH